MIKTLTGANSFGLQAELHRLVDAFTKEYGDLAVERIDGQEAEFNQIQAALTSLPFLVNKKLVVLREADNNKQFAEAAEQILSEVPETTDVILLEPKLDKRLSYYKFLKKRTDFREFPELDMNGLANWLVESAKLNDGSLNSGDARYLVERVGQNQQLLSNELEKLLLFSKNMTRESIDKLTDSTPQSTIFQLLEAAFAGNTRRTLDLYREQRALKVEPPQIVAMLTWQLNILAIIKTAKDRTADQIAKDAKLNPFVVRKSQGVANKLGLTELKSLIADLLRIDVASKRTSLDADEALQNYLLKLST
jgi:DNA polymerase-3 subunit delta